VNFDAAEIYRGSNGDATKALYGRLQELGPAGLIALNLFRAQKCSERAKGYTRRHYKVEAYQRKSWSIDQLADVLQAHAVSLGMAWGWREDPDVLFGDRISWVFYVDTPYGQISFHSPERGRGPDYPGNWDGQRGASVARAIAFCQAVLDGVVLAASECDNPLFPGDPSTCQFDPCKCAENWPAETPAVAAAPEQAAPEQMGLFK
jgi:hypothetical protein